jgi:hypothetical protein
VRATQTRAQTLRRVDIDGHSMAFGSALLLRRSATSRSVESWYVILLRVPSQDTGWAQARAGQECELQAETWHGEKLSGRVSPVDSATAPDSLRLAGVSPLTVT